MKLALDQIRIDGGTQPRSALDFDAIDDYAEAMQGGTRFPAVVVFYDGSDYWLADGFHRLKAAWQADREEIEVDVVQGTLEDAKWFSFSANKSNGLRRTNEDKQRAVKAALEHPKSRGLSDSAIAKHVGVDQVTVGRWRNKMEASYEVHKIDVRTVTRNGTTYQQDVTNIGRRKQEDSAAVFVPIEQPSTPLRESERVTLRDVSQEEFQVVASECIEMIEHAIAQLSTLNLGIADLNRLETICELLATLTARAKAAA